MRATPKAERIYVCLGCDGRWQYAEIRNTARCPACGDGLARTRPKSGRTEPPPHRRTVDAQLTAANCASTNASAAA